MVFLILIKDTKTADNFFPKSKYCSLILFNFFKLILNVFEISKGKNIKHNSHKHY